MVPQGQVYKEFLKEAARRRAKIKALRTKGVSQAEVARLFSISQQRVSQIEKGK